MNKKLDENRESTLQSINKSEDVYNDDIIVTRSRLQRNQSSVGQDTTVKLSTKDGMVKV